MDITKDNYFNVEYNSSRNVLEMKKHKKGKKHNIAIGVLSATFILVAINLALIYKFFEILFTL